MAVRSERAEQQGSITVLVVFLMPVMILMLLLVANIGQAIYEKVRLQNTVDACALAAATVQAAGLNEIADLNFEIGEEFRKLLIMMLTTWLWQDKIDGDNAISYYKKVFKALHRYQDEANRDFASAALRVARSVQRENLPKARLESINPNEKELMRYRTESKTVSFWYRICSCCPCGLHCQCQCCPFLPTWTWNDGMAGPEDYFGPHDGRMFRGDNGILCPVPGMGTVKTKIRKTGPTTYSAFKLTQPSQEFIFAGGVFGGMDELTAYAAAKPAGGDVYQGDPDYKPVMVQLRSLRPAPRVSGNLQRFEH